MWRADEETRQRAKWRLVVGAGSRRNTATICTRNYAAAEERLNLTISDKWESRLQVALRLADIFCFLRPDEGQEPGVGKIRSSDLGIAAKIAQYQPPPELLHYYVLRALALHMIRCHALSGQQP